MSSIAVVMHCNHRANKDRLQRCNFFLLFTNVECLRSNYSILTGSDNWDRNQRRRRKTITVDRCPCQWSSSFWRLFWTFYVDEKWVVCRTRNEKVECFDVEYTFGTEHRSFIFHSVFFFSHSIFPGFSFIGISCVNDEPSIHNTITKFEIQKLFSLKNFLF